MDAYHDLELTIDKTQICTSNLFMGLGGLLFLLDEDVSFELGKYNPVRNKIIQKEWYKSKRTFGKPENFTQYVRVFGPSLIQEMLMT